MEENNCQSVPYQSHFHFRHQQKCFLIANNNNINHRQLHFEVLYYRTHNAHGR